NIGTLANGGTVTATITAQATEDGNLTNSASVASDSGDPTPNDNSASATTAVAEASINVSGPITLSGRKLNKVAVATFTHANGVEPASAFAATINWGDGTTSTGAITQSGTTYTVTGSHSYKGKPTPHKITTTVVELGNAPNLNAPAVATIGLRAAPLLGTPNRSGMNPTVTPVMVQLPAQAGTRPPSDQAVASTNTRLLVASL